MHLLRLGDWRLLLVSRKRLREHEARGIMGSAQPGPTIGGQGPPHLSSAEPERKAGRHDVGDPVPRRLLVYNVLDWCQGKPAAANRQPPAPKLALEQEDTNGSSPR